MRTPRFIALPPLTKAYISAIVAAGVLTVLHSFYDLAVHPIGWHWTVLALLTLASGSATVRLPSLPATISVSETFVFTSVLLFGASAGTLTVALDALVISFWSYKRGHPTYKIIFNVFALPLTIWLAAHLFFLTAAIRPLAGNAIPIDVKDLLAPLLLFTIAYFTLNSWIITFAISLEKRLPPFTIWRDNFVRLSLNYFGGASVAVLLVTYTKDLDFGFLAIIVPLLVVLYFTFSTSLGRVEDANKHLTQLNDLYMSTIETLAMAIDAKDQITHGHIRRVQSYAIALAKEAGVSDASLIKAIEAAALLHDMGKLAVPEYILNKPGKLTPAEFEKMKRHASVGADILSAVKFPYPVVPIVRHHHEQWDGKGYPDGLSGTQIPIGARILSIVDCYDALTSDRPYRPRLSDKDALAILLERRGTMYDPLIVDTFVKSHPKITDSYTSIQDDAHLFELTGTPPHDTPTSPVHASGLDNIAASAEESLTLFEMTRELSSPMSFRDVGDVTSKHLRRLVPCSVCILFVYDAQAVQIVAKHASGDNATLAADLRLDLGERLSGWVAANRQSIRNSDPVLDLGESARSFKPRLRSCLSTPLLLEQDLVGVITLYAPQANAFTEEHQRVVETVANQVSPIIRRHLDIESSTVSHEPTPLVEIPTLDQIRQLGEPGLAGTRRVTSTMSLLLVSVIVGSKSGELEIPVGDIMMTVANVTRQHVRPGDLLFRGTEGELAAILMNANDISADTVAASVRRALAMTILASRVDMVLDVRRVSSPNDGGTLEELLEAARRQVSLVPPKNQRRDSMPPGSIH
jgi:putative nucleotidyltransferase with HDIG domain